MRTKSVPSSLAGRRRTLGSVLGATQLDEAVRAWLAQILEDHKRVQVSRWMGYKKSRTQLDGYMKHENLAFRVEWIEKIAAGLGISTEQALVEIRDKLRDLPKPATVTPASPLAGKNARLAEQSSEQPQGRSAKKAK